MKPILCLCLCLLSVSAFCQVKVGVQAGYNYTTFAGDDILPVADYYYHASARPGFNAGIISSIPLVKRLFLQPSLLLSEKGAKEKSGGGFSGRYYYTNLRLYYAHLPVQVMYTVISRKPWQLSAGGGFFMSTGIWGKSKQSFIDYDSTGQPYTAHTHFDVNFTNDIDNYKPGKRNVKAWDAGYTIAAAAGWQHWQLKAAYDFGVTKIIDLSDHHRTGVFSLSAGYYFIKKKKEAHGELSQPDLR